MKEKEIEDAREAARRVLAEAGITLGPSHEIEITDFGKGDFATLGLALVIRVAEPEYASKWLVCFDGQTCPNHYHAKIKETFFVLKGGLTMVINDGATTMKPGDQLTMKPGTWHAFTAEGDTVIEEVTNRQWPNDSFFEDTTIARYATVEKG